MLNIIPIVLTDLSKEIKTVKNKAVPLVSRSEILILIFLGKILKIIPIVFCVLSRENTNYKRRLNKSRAVSLERSWFLR